MNPTSPFNWSYTAAGTSVVLASIITVSSLHPHFGESDAHTHWEPPQIVAPIVPGTIVTGMSGFVEQPAWTQIVTGHALG